MSIEKMEFGFAHGFTRGMMCVQDALNYVLTDLKRHKRRFNQKEMLAMVKAMIEGRELLRDDPSAFVRCTQDGGWEVYVQKKGVNA